MAYSCVVTDDRKFLVSLRAPSEVNVLEVSRALFNYLRNISPQGLTQGLNQSCGITPWVPTKSVSVRQLIRRGLDADLQYSTKALAQEVE